MIDNLLSFLLAKFWYIFEYAFNKVTLSIYIF